MRRREEPAGGGPRAAARKLVLVAAGSAAMAAAVAAPAGAQPYALPQPVSPERQAMYEKYLAFGAHLRTGVAIPNWVEGGERFWYVALAPTGPTVTMVDAATGEKRALDRAPESEAGDADAAAGADAGGEDDEFAAFLRGPPLPSPTDGAVLFSRAGDLWLRDAAGGERRLTRDGAADHGWTTRVARWSPDGRRFVAMKSDMRGIHRIPVLHPLQPKDSVSWMPYWLTGEAVPSNELHLFDARTGERLRVATGPAPEFGFHLLEWRDDGRTLRLLERDRYSRWVEMLDVDAATGETRVVLEERPETFVDGLGWPTPGASVYTPLEDGRFLWMSERDGWYHVYLHEGDGTLVRQLTRGEFRVMGVEHVDERGGWVYVTARAEPGRPYDTHLYRVRLDGSRFQRLTEAPGQHRVSFAPDGRAFVDLHASLERAPRSELRRADGTLVTVLEEADLSSLEELRWRPPEAFVVKAADGVTDLHGVIYRPWDFDASKRYPVVDVLYHGPHSQFAPKTMLDLAGCQFTYCQQPLAQLGFVVVTVDARGTAGRSKAFLDATFEGFGTVEIEDHAAALRGLAAERPWMDLERVGIAGYSFGGYYAMRGMIQAPDLFDVGIVGAPVVDYRQATPGVVEPYLGPVAENPEAYEHANLLDKVDRMEGRVLLVHGTADVNVPVSQTLKLADALIRAGKVFDMLIVPDQPHVPVGQPGAYMREAVHRYLVEHLIVTPPGAPPRTP